ncbi:outer membrane lipoprotein chaperone LolA [Marinomonas sp. M1K-6]|uniref:Outer-membrane lipoprotein carrier protein n=1 Tax=Marinomonas profundi TaxID=2726122 RepID=A0A847R2X7_9GAMM|nr:outer membrane lipoprotein chaperone LolA [Marinomonas profundi]NLQ16693.1 outer membrane lipoprotein chaperone LolA [Marinomonas profundi]UDV03731.1 outer membrane lipoprotein chaperone LolA [Marinomonas profundi]
MLNKLIAITVLGVVLAFQSVTVQAEDAINNIENLLEMNRNIEGEFRQVTYDEKGKQLQVSEGIFLLAKPNQFVWDSVTPFAQRIISDGKYITVWDVDLEQATKKPLSGAVGNSPAALLGQPAAEVLPHYEVTALGKEKFSLAPKEDQDLFQTLTLSFRDKVISAMSILDALGQTTVIEFKNVETHEGVAKENFVLDLPDNVDVIVEGQ